MVERRAPTSTGIVRDFELAFTSEHTWNEEFEDITPMEYMQSQSSCVNKE
ncbi:hypothetical protein PHLCEN_2v7198 [Hermanssonia centrifuga]|uniref:Uncharacterized protein n=1 Tax=Hermanssonia centrifuga TaxID=98765 RepID=A0A2R6NX64_9APHY|nr:hypothetical protein PHLCEN_2v7198 [Hermanssonia centrifuga]